MLVASPKDTFTTSDGCRIAYRLRPGSKRDSHRLALVHPLALDGSVWNGVAEILGGSVSLLTYDCRGHGASERSRAPYTIDLFARDLAELLDHVGWSDSAVAGCSMGGCVALGFAGRYPNRLKGLGLIDTTAWYGPDAPRTWRERAARARDIGLDGMLEFQKDRWYSQQFRDQNNDIVDSVNRIFLANDVQCYQSTCLMLGDADLRPIQSSIHVPVAIVVGEEDFATPVAMAQQLHDSISGSTLAVLGGVRHLAPVEAPNLIAAQLQTLLDRVD